MIPTTYKKKVYQVTFWCNVVDSDGNVIEELESEKADFDTCGQAEQFIKENPVGSEYGYYADGTFCIISDINFDYEPIEIELFYTRAEREELQKAEEREKLIERFKCSQLDRNDIITAVKCLETYLQDCSESEERQTQLREIIRKLNAAAGSD